jgi:hypothetical protein
LQLFKFSDIWTIDKTHNKFLAHELKMRFKPRKNLTTCQQDYAAFETLYANMYALVILSIEPKLDEILTTAASGCSPGCFTSAARFNKGRKALVIIHGAIVFTSKVRRIMSGL